MRRRADSSSRNIYKGKIELHCQSSGISSSKQLPQISHSQGTFQKLLFFLMWYRIFSTLTREFFRFNLYLIFLTIRSFLLCCSTEPMLIVSNCNFPMTRSVILLVGLLVSHNFLKGGKLHFHASIGALVYYLMFSNYFTSRKIALGCRDWFS